MGFGYYQIHASGHAPIGGVRRFVEEIAAKKLVPVHTENPSMFSSFRCRVSLPVKGKPIAC